MLPAWFAKAAGAVFLSLTTLSLLMIGLEGYLDRKNKRRRKKPLKKKE